MIQQIVAATKNALRDNEDVFDAWKAVKLYCDSKLPYGFKLPAGGRYPPQAEDENT